MTRNPIKAKEILQDMRNGMDDAGLMIKYGLSSKQILKVINMLLWKGLMSPEELADRRSLAKTVYMPTFKCPSCAEIHFTKSDTCPKCKASMTRLSQDPGEIR